MKETRKNGFTLIELLVVISLISALSSVILASVHEARQHAIVAKNNIIAHQYKLALDLYYFDNGHYPARLHTDGQTFECLSDYDNDRCGYNDGYIEHPEIYSALLQYIPNLPKMETVVLSDALYFNGPTYYCDTGAQTADPFCDHAAHIEWIQPTGSIANVCGEGKIQKLLSGKPMCRLYVHTNPGPSSP